MDEIAFQKLMRVRNLQRDIARRCGISSSAVCQWTRVPRKRLIEVSEVVGLPPEQLRPDLYPGAAPSEAAE